MDPIRLKWEGSFFVNHSLALVNREICRRLAKMAEVEISLIPYEKDEFTSEGDPARLQILVERTGAALSKDCEIHLRHQWPPKLIAPTQGRWIIFQPWEFGSIRREWLLYFRHLADEVWVYSNYNKNCYVEDGIPEDRVKVIPLGIDPAVFKPDLKPQSAQWVKNSQRSFKFLFVGGTIYRKGIDILLAAYQKAFTKDDDVCLVIKGMGASSFYSNNSLVNQILSLQNNSSVPQILYLDETIPGNRMAELYHECDCLVHPYRGEGFGLPVAEAMACGLPVILTKGGACDDFTNSDMVYYLSQVEKKLINIDQITTRDAWVLEPNAEELAAKMKAVYKNKKEASQLGLKASRHIHTHFTWDKTAETVLKQLKECRGKSIARHYVPLQETKGEKIEEAFIQAENLLEQEKFEEASKQYLQLLEKYPQRFEPCTGLGLVAWYLKHYEEAQRWFASALKINPIDEDTLFNFCDVSLKLGQPQTAEYVLKQALSLKPGLSEVARYLERLQQETLRGGGIRFEKFVAQREIIKKGEKLLREGLVKEASEIFMVVLQVDPEDFEALCDMGVIYYYAKDYASAYEWFIKSLMIAPTVQDTLINLFDAALKIKKVEEIVPVLRQAVQMRPELSDVSSILAQIDALGPSVYSIENFDSIDETEEIYRKGVAFLEAVELNQATLCFLDVVDKKPYNDRAFNGLGVIAFYRKNYSDAYALFHHAVQLNPLNADAILNLFDTAKKLNKEEEVRPYLENISQIDTNPAIHNALQEIS